MAGYSFKNFATDFWKDAKTRLSWDQLFPGELRKSQPITLTKEDIAYFARNIGETNPLYFDEEYAKKTPYGGIIAPLPIHILLMFACTSTEDWMRSPGTVNAGQNWSYNEPIRPGDTITMRASCLDRFIKKGRLFAVHENVFFNQRGKVVITGRGQTIRPE